MFLPSKRTWPPVAGTRRRIVRPTVVLPQPDSPTRPSVSPRLIENVTSSTAFTQATVRCRRPPRTGKYLTKRATSSIVACFLGAPGMAVSGLAPLAVMVALPPPPSVPSAPGWVGVGDPRSAGEWSDCVLCWSLISGLLLILERLLGGR